MLTVVGDVGLSESAVDTVVAAVVDVTAFIVDFGTIAAFAFEVSAVAFI